MALRSWELGKYGNQPSRCARGQFHHSKGEAEQCNALHALEAAGQITELQAHPQRRHRLEVNGHHVCDVIPDFEFRWVNSGELVTLDFKGCQTAESRIKYKLFEALFGREVQLVRKPWAFR